MVNILLHFLLDLSQSNESIFKMNNFY